MINPLVIQNCPESLKELPANANFGDAVKNILENSEIYHKCRKSALIEQSLEK